MTDKCAHKNLPVVPFDAEAAKALDSYDVRKRWPRLDQECPDCKARVISYASFEHYIAGDY